MCGLNPSSGTLYVETPTPPVEHPRLALSRKADTQISCSHAGLLGTWDLVPLLEASSLPHHGSVQSSKSGARRTTGLAQGRVGMLKLGL